MLYICHPVFRRRRDRRSSLSRPVRRSRISRRLVPAAAPHLRAPLPAPRARLLARAGDVGPGVRVRRLPVRAVARLPERRTPQDARAVVAVAFPAAVAGVEP